MAAVAIIASSSFAETLSFLVASFMKASYTFCSSSSFRLYPSFVATAVTASMGSWAVSLSSALSTLPVNPKVVLPSCAAVQNLFIWLIVRFIDDVATFVLTPKLSPFPAITLQTFSRDAVFTGCAAALISPAP